jgi:uncharacterized membrane protein
MNPRNKKSLFLIIVIILLVIGIFFRLYNLDRPVYWHDEVFTSIRTSGYNGETIVNNEFQGKIISPQDLLRYQTIPPDNTWRQTLERLIEHPEHPPLYYICSWSWQKIFGSSIFTVRSLSVLFSLLVFPSIYWLCWELFNSTTIARMAIAITAISPLHIVYAKEAREYSLWTVTILLASAALLRAIKVSKPEYWLIYAICLALSFYTSLLSILVAIAHIIYLVFREKLQINKTTIGFILAHVGAIFLFAPWLQIIYQNAELLQNKTEWTHTTKSFLELWSAWELHINSIFIDLSPLISLKLAPRLTPLFLLLISYSLYFVCRFTYRKTCLFLLAIILIPAAGLIVPDLIFGGQKSIMTRYFFPSFIGMEITIAFWLVEARSNQNQLRWLIFYLLVIVGLASAIMSSQSSTWWNKLVGYDNAKIAAIINEYDRPLLISNDRDINVGNLISLSYLLSPDVKLLLVDLNTIPQIPKGNFSHILVLNLGDKSLQQFQQQNNCLLKIIPGNYYPSLWLGCDSDKPITDS